MTNTDVQVVEDVSMLRPVTSDPDTLFVRDFCIPYLVGAQNQDGGWSYHHGGESRVEPACWCVRAFNDLNDPLLEQPRKAALGYLLSTQLRDGSWPSCREEVRGSWVTSLACSVLSSEPECQRSVSAGLRWLCKDFPRDSAPWRVFLQRVIPSSSPSSQDDSLRGWGWTPRTSSWVEPTAFALMALRDAPREVLPAGASFRSRSAVELLYDRMCPGGGWNCGNPMVYGVPGEPLVLPTAWALLALKDQPTHEKKSKSLIWLRDIYAQIASPASLAIAQIVLQAYGVNLPVPTQPLRTFFDPRNFLGVTREIAWTCLALTPQRTWAPPHKGAA